MPSLRVIPLGGCGEFGRNLTLYETDEDLLAVDCGAEIPHEDAPGVDRFVPELAYLIERRERLRGWVITHGHDDHLGALAHALERCPAPVYARPLALALARAQLRRAAVTAELHRLEVRAPVQLGGFTVEALCAAHSIPDACALAITGAGRRVLHSGDLKLDPEAHAPTDLRRLGELGAAGIDLLVGDSTNAPRPGRCPSEHGVIRALTEAVSTAPRRVAVALFSSNVQRIGAVLETCARTERRLCLVGRGLKEMWAAAVEVGALHPPPGVLIDEATARRTPPERLALLCTGSQGEPRAALGRIAAGEHPLLTLDPGDRVIFSSRPVPGNERRVEQVVDLLYTRGVEIVDQGVHASGHGYAEDLEELIALCRPRALLPVHGRPRQQHAHAALAARAGVPSLIVDSGAVVEVSDEVKRIGRVGAGRVALEGSRVGDVGPATLRARRALARTGVVVVAEVEGRLRVEAHAVAEGPELPALLLEAERRAEAARAAADPAGAGLAIRRAVRRTFHRARGVKPEVIVLV